MMPLISQWLLQKHSSRAGMIFLSFAMAAVIFGLIMKVFFTPNLPDDPKEYKEQGNGIRVLCFLMTQLIKKKNIVAVKETWGKRCDKFLLIMDVEDKELGSIKLKGVKEGRHLLWGKVRESYKYMYDNYLDDFDWFYNADYDTYLIVENLRYVLTPYDPDFPLALGKRLITKQHPYPYPTRDLLSGGAGYVLSRGALKVYGEVGYPNDTLCKFSPDGADDTMMGVCMTQCGIMLGDTRDEFGRHRFFQRKPEDYMNEHWYPKVVKYRIEKGIESVPETAVSFHNMKSPAQLYALEFLIYKLQLFGVQGRFHGPTIAPLPPDTNSIPQEVLKRFGHPALTPTEKDTDIQ